MTPKKVQLPKDTTAITVYIKKDLLKKLDSGLEGRARNRVLVKLIEGYVRGEVAIDWWRE